MKYKRFISREARALTIGIFSAMLTIGNWLHAQPVFLSVQASNHIVVISWPSGLSQVQLEKSTNLAAQAWAGLGGPTTNASQTDVSRPGSTFYRLRFLGPSILQQPESESVASGSNATFYVKATGTAPLGYRWLKNDSPLAGQTGPMLNLTAVTLNDQGNYTVVVTNRVGSVTSSVVTLTITIPPPPHGIYMGSFAGQADNGGFALMVRSNGTAVAMGYNTPQDEGVYVSNLSVAADGTFSAATSEGGTVSGQFTDTGVSGTFINSMGASGSFSGSRKADTGIHAADAGYYSGTYSGALTGNAYAIGAADGTVFFFTTGSTGEGGGFGTISAANSFSGSTVPDNITVTGTLNTTTKTLSGSYLSGGTPLGSFSLTRTSTP